MAEKRKMKAVKAWTVVVPTGDAMSPTAIYGDKRKAERHRALTVLTNFVDRLTGAKP